MKQIYSDQFNGVRDLIRTKLVELGTASLAVAVAQDGNILWEEGSVGQTAKKGYWRTLILCIP